MRDYGTHPLDHLEESPKLTVIRGGRDIAGAVEEPEPTASQRLTAYVDELQATYPPASKPLTLLTLVL